jgi:hypothetical protein
MQTLNTLNQIAAALVSLPNAQVVIVYEKFYAGLKAKQFFDRQIAPAEPARRPRFQMWGFAGLRFDSVRAHALRDALESDMVCLALLSDAKLPEGVKVWAESWAHERGSHHCLMVVLLESMPVSLPGNSPIIQFLRDVAGKANAEFLMAPLDPFGLEQNPHVFETTSRL